MYVPDDSAARTSSVAICALFSALLTDRILPAASAGLLEVSLMILGLCGRGFIQYGEELGAVATPTHI